MSEHFICKEMVEAGEKALKEAKEKAWSRKRTAREVFLVMREIERMALMRGINDETVH